MKAIYPTSKGTWGRRTEPSEQEAEKHAIEFFSKLIVHERLRYEGVNNVVVPDEHGKEQLLSHGIVLKDMEESNVWYKIVVVRSSGRGAVCERKLSEKGAVSYSCKVMNKTAEGINEYLSKMFLYESEE